MGTYIQNFLKYKTLLITLVERDIKIKYRRSVLGVFWSLLNPLLMMVILSIVFSNLFKFNVENYPIYILSGQVIFNFFNESTTSSMNAIIGNSSLINKVYLPKYLFVLSNVFSSLINLFASFTALLLVMLAMGVELHFTSFLAIIPLLLISVFSLGVGMFLSAITVKFRDFKHLWGVFTTGLMYLTPVIYPISLLRSNRVVELIVTFNPITNYLSMFRKVMMYNTLPSFNNYIVGIIEALVVLAIGLIVFYRRQDTFILDL